MVRQLLAATGKAIGQFKQAGVGQFLFFTRFSGRPQALSLMAARQVAQVDLIAI